MGRKKTLNKQERYLIIQLRKNGQSNRSIAKMIIRSEKAVREVELVLEFLTIEINAFFSISAEKIDAKLQE